MTHLKALLTALPWLCLLGQAAHAEPMTVSCRPEATSSDPAAPCATEFYAMLPVAEDYAAQDVLVTSGTDQCHAVTLTFLLPGKQVHVMEGVKPGKSQRLSFAKLQPIGGEFDETLPETDFQSSPFYPEIMLKAVSDGGACNADRAPGWDLTLDLVPAAPLN